MVELYLKSHFFSPEKTILQDERKRGETRTMTEISGAEIEIRELRRTFTESSPIIDGLNLTIGSGEFVSLLGPSGCGKSTLLRLIADLDQPDQGTVRCAVAQNRQRFYRGFVFQEAQLLPWRTVLGNVMLPLELMRLPRTEATERARVILQRVGMGHAIAKLPAELSGGMKMRVAVARALVSSPRLLLLDEPFAALDEITRFQLQEDLYRLWLQEKMTVVFVTHSVSEAVFLSERAVLLSSKPARVVLDHKSSLARERNRETRLDAKYIQEVVLLTQASYQEEAR
jgi:NitT/TauT family transport system ATP-binding protein